MQLMIDIDPRDAAYYAEIAIHRGWDVAAQQALTQLANTGEPFTAHDFRDLLGDAKPHHPNTIGSFFRIARKDGLIRPTGRFIESPTPSRHAAAVREWVGVAPHQCANT